MANTTEITANDLRERDRIMMTDGSLAEVAGVMTMSNNRVHVIVRRDPASRSHDEVLPGNARVRVAADRPEPVAIATF